MQRKGGIMITFQITTDVKDDRRVVLTLPSEVPTGRAELVVQVQPASPGNEQLQTGLAEWVEAHEQRDGNGRDRYPLRGSVVRFDQPTEPVAETDWEAMQ
jgi:hypothetical protein